MTNCKRKWRLPAVGLMSFGLIIGTLAAGEAEMPPGTFRSIAPAQVKVGGEMGRRIDLTIQKNLLVLAAHGFPAGKHVHRDRETD